MIEEIKYRVDHLEAMVATKLDKVDYEPVVSELDIIKNDIVNLKGCIEELHYMIQHEQEQRKKFMIALIEAGEDGLL